MSHLVYRTSDNNFDKSSSVKLGTLVSVLLVSTVVFLSGLYVNITSDDQSLYADINHLIKADQFVLSVNLEEERRAGLYDDWVDNIDETLAEASQMISQEDVVHDKVLPPDQQKAIDVFSQYYTKDDQIAIKDRLMVFKEEVKRGDSLSQVLLRMGLQNTQSHLSIKSLEKSWDPKTILPKQAFYAFFDSETNAYLGLYFLTPNHKKYVLHIDDELNYNVNADRVQLARQKVYKRVVVNNSVYQAGLESSIPVQVMASFVRNMSHSVDFSKSIHKGDSFELIYENLIDESNEVVSSDRVLYAAIDAKNKKGKFYYYTDKDGHGDYYDEEGNSISKSFFISPLKARISSRYGMRLHPILKKRKMHTGVDYAARTGTPIKASATGKVAFIGRKGGYGKYVGIKHRDGFYTAYAHLSRYAKIKKGQHINQGQIIGYVGNTGRSTGSHLHFEIKKNNRHTNPLAYIKKKGIKLRGDQLKAFYASKKQLDNMVVAHNNNDNQADKQQVTFNTRATETAVENF